MILTFRKKTGEVVMLGQFIANDVLSSVELSDDQRMTQGYVMKVKDGGVEYTKSWWMLDKEAEDAKKIEFTKNIDEINKAKSVEELKPLLIKLIQNNT